MTTCTTVPSIVEALATAIRDRASHLCATIRVKGEMLGFETATDYVDLYEYFADPAEAKPFNDKMNSLVVDKRYSWYSEAMSMHSQQGVPDFR